MGGADNLGVGKSSYNILLPSPETVVTLFCIALFLLFERRGDTSEKACLASLHNLYFVYFFFSNNHGSGMVFL